MRLAAPTDSGLGRVLPIFGARTAASAPTLPLPFRSRKRAKARAPASARISERLPIAVAAPRRHEGAHILRASALASCLSEGAPPRCSARKSRNWQGIAPVGLQRLRRHAPLGAEIAANARFRRRRRGPTWFRVCSMPWRISRGRVLYIRLPSPFLKQPKSLQTRRAIPKSEPVFGKITDRPEPMTTRIVDVLVPVALDQTYSYRVPEELDACAGRSGGGAARRARRMHRAWSGRITPRPIRACTTG